MSKTECYVSAADYALHWQRRKPKVSHMKPPVAYVGPERRTGPADRRRTGHDRRWEFTRGRRYRLADRRKSTP